jgi:hypothetical protein
VDIKYQESIKAWHRITMIKELIIIALSAVLLCVMLTIRMTTPLTAHQWYTANIGIDLFVVAIFFSIVSINQTLEKLTIELSGSGIVYNKSVWIYPIQMLSFYLGLAAVVCFGQVAL